MSGRDFKASNVNFPDDAPCNFTEYPNGIGCNGTIIFATWGAFEALGWREVKDQ